MKLSIAKKLNLLTIFVIVLTALAVGSYMIRQYQARAFENFVKQSEQVAVLLSENVELGVYTENNEFLKHSLINLHHHPDIAFLVVMNQSRNVLVKRNFHDLPQLPAFTRTVSMDQRELKVGYYFEPNSSKSYINIVAPIFVSVGINEDHSNAVITHKVSSHSESRPIGYLQLGFAQDRIYNDSMQLVWHVLFIVFTVILLGVALAVWQARRITRPINQLVLATQSIAGGQFGEQFQSSSNDEIAALTKAFNHMSAELADHQKNASKRQSILEEQVAQRSQALQDKIEDTHRLAERTEAERRENSNFLATMSHEIRTPMNGVLGMTELLLNTELDYRQLHLVETVYYSAESLLTVMNNIIDFSKIEAGKFQFIKSDFDLRGLLDSTIKMVQRQADTKRLQLTAHFPANLCGVFNADSERLQQILLNLLVNAIKHTPHGEVRLKVSCVESGKSDPYPSINFEIQDAGPGISPEQQVAIFERFVEIDGSIENQYGGARLGLSIANQLVGMMGGELSLKSEVGQGTCFYFSLNMNRKSYLAPNKQDSSVLKGLKVLIVDGNATTREILLKQLNQWEVQCACLPNGEQAIEHVREASMHNKYYHIAILDWYMPDMDGISLAKLLFEEPLLYTPALVMLNSHVDSIDTGLTSKNGIRHVLTKPIFQQKLLDCLLELAGSLHNFQPTKKETTPIESLGKILLVEDNILNQKIGGDILREVGCEVEVVNNGVEAIASVAKKQYDLIFMDCHMPGMDGFKATKEIRALEQEGQSHTTIVALTADVHKDVVKQCQDVGMDDYISKPFSHYQIKEVLAKWFLVNKEDSVHLHASQKNVTQLVQIKQESIHSELVDLLVLDNLRQLTTENDENLLDEVVKLFVESAPDDVKSLQDALDSQDTLVLGQIAHRFKSACANLGANTLTSNAALIEKTAKQGSIQNVDQLITTMKSDLPGVLEILRQICGLTMTATDTEIEICPTQIAKKEKYILVVDDDENFRTVTRSTLVSANFVVDEADNGRAALEKIKQRKPDLIILDAEMGGLDGFETCRLIRADTSIVDMPIIMSTGLGELESIDNAFESGATDFIVKPINFPILIHRLWFIIRADEVFTELKNSKHQLSSAQRIARLGYWIWNVEDNYFQISDQLAELCRIRQDDFYTTLDGYINLVVPEDQERVKFLISEAFSCDVVQDIEYHLRVPGDKPITVHQEISRMTQDGHEVLTGTVQDISQIKTNEKQIHYLAYFDPLTGLANRTCYQDHIRSMIKKSKNRNEKLAFLFLDLDGFKDINDSMGHDLGDLLLKNIAKRLQEVIRDVDFAARLGGDEFCILLNDANQNELVAEVAQRCLKKVNTPLFLNNQQIKPRVSIGIAIYPQDGINEVDLMKAADTAMYAAKQAGKQCFAFYSQDMAVEATSRLDKEQMLRDAFDKEQFELYYQPQVSMQTGRIVGLEALVRWIHPLKGVISPGEFIPLLEQIGLIVDLGNWALRTACQQIAAWYEAGHPYIQIAVNISPLHFKDDGLVGTIDHLLEEFDIPPEYLELEVTESAMQAEKYLDIFKELREIGVRISIDDFGTGYSCLASLKQLPLDCIKIDKIFVDDVLTNTHTPLLLGAIIGLANALKYKLVAEGVESKEQAVVMHGLGCQIIQGYLFSPPVPGNEIPVLLNKDFLISSNLLS